jgi:uroporphyrinogen-III synthase
MRVLVLRPADGAKRTAARLAELGHEAIVAPVLAPATTGLPAPAGAFDAILATSAQAFALTPEADLAPLRKLPLACVGERTVRAARTAGFGAPMTQAPDAASLVRALAPTAPGVRYLYLAGHDRKPALEADLQAAGASVTPWEVYEARAVSALPEAAALALASGSVDAALHFSRRSAEAFCALCAAAGLTDHARAARHLAISRDAAAGLADLASSGAEVASTPDEAGLLALL